MGHTYRTVTWNRQKRIYDLVLWSGIVGYLIVFMVVGGLTFPNVTIETLLLRSTSTCAFLLLHIILSIGPLTRLDTRFLPLLYNRRHMGVSMFGVALVHATLAFIQFHALGDLNPFVSVFVSGTAGDILSSIPFQAFGALALLILFLMAATSHDFWLSQFSAPTWKRLHMLVYGAYFLLVGHVAFGYVQDATSPVPGVLLGIGATWVVGIHLAAGFRELKYDRPVAPEDVSVDGYVRVCSVDDIEENEAVTATISGERVAVFKHGNRFSAVSNVCQHQNGPLGEGRIIDGYITCPWHGYQYCPLTGKSPEPFTERIPTFDVRVEGNSVFVSDHPNQLGEEGQFESSSSDDSSSIP
ncbi:MAG: ferric reductase-like transmembrane domain-containing protein [Bacteroidetes bacterium]|nr:ferric reductase-like transmembrane domain-containing protein [Bacteroidota bacterium]